MKPKYRFTIVLHLILMSWGFSAEAATLGECYAWASAKSESLKIRQEAVNQSKAKSRAAIGTIFPYLDWQFTDTWQDPDGVDELSRRGFSGFVQKNQVESKFSLKQPLFSGFREFSAHTGFKHEMKRNDLLLKRASLELYERTARAFYNVIDSETTRKNVEAAWRLAQDQVDELRRFVKLGKSRNSEVSTAVAHAAALRARLDQIDAQIIDAREDLSFLTGRDLTHVTLQDDIPPQPTLGTLEEVVRRAALRTDIQAQREETEARRLQIRYERGSFWPTADVTGNYYTRRANYLDAIDWDVILSLKVPFYQGGEVAARVREAKSVHLQSVYVLEEMERQINHTVRKLYGQLAAAQRESESLQEASKAAEESYRALRREYGLGLVTNLDVLQSVDFLQNQNTARDTAQLKVKWLYIALNVALEQMP